MSTPTRWRAALAERARSVPADLWLLAALLVPVVAIRLVHAAALPGAPEDGTWLEIARSVRAGDGLVSWTVAPYPGPSPLPPAWPVVLGLAAHLVELAGLARWLPVALASVSLVLAGVVGRRLWPEALVPELVPALHGGHVLVLVLGLSPALVRMTALPTPEALGWVVVLGFLARALARPTGPELALWALAAVHVGPELVVVPAAVLAAAPLWLVGPGRRPVPALVAVAGAITAVAIRPIAPALALPAPVEPLHWAASVAAPFVAAGVGLQAREAVRRPETFGRVVVLVVAVGLAVQGGRLALLPSALALIWLIRSRSGLAGPARDPAAASTVDLGEREARTAGATAGEIAGEVETRLGAGLRAGVDAPAPGWARLLRTFGLLVLSAVLLGAVLDLARPLTPAPSRARDRELVAWLRRLPERRVAMAEADVARLAWRTEGVGYLPLSPRTPYADLLGVPHLVLDPAATRAWRFSREGAGQLEHDFAARPETPAGRTVLTRRDAPPPALPPQRVLLIGVDGASWKVLAPMVERGELPAFRRLRVEGASQVDLATLDRTDSPLIWTSVATGRLPEDHGVLGYTEDLPGVGKVPITSHARKVPALWNLASDAGKRVAVVNWWASWPAEQVDGVIVSDHANPAAAGWMEGTYWEADPAALAALQGDTWPPELARALAPQWVDPEQFPLDRLQQAARLTEGQLALVEAAPFNQRSTWSWFKTFYALDAPHARIGAEQAATADLAMVYLRGPDPVQHYAWNTVEPERYLQPPPTLARDRGVVQSVYRYTDGLLGDLLAAAGPDTTVIVLSDHGAEPAADAWKSHPKKRPGAHTAEARGVLFVWGPAVRPGHRLEGASVMDIAPTVAWILGLPVADDLPGRVLAEAFTLEFRERRGRQRVPTWGTRASTGSATASPADQTMLEQLRGLGYVE